MPSPAITIIANFMDLTGVATSGYVVFQLISPTGQIDLEIVGTGMFAPKTITSSTGTSISQLIYGNDVIVDTGGNTNTYYDVTCYDVAGHPFWSAYYKFTGSGTFNLVGLTPLNPAPVISVPTVTPLPVSQGGTGVSQANANTVFSGPVSGGAGAAAFRNLVNADFQSSLTPAFTSLTLSSLTPGNCVQATTGGLLVTTSGPCGTSSGTLTGTGSPSSGNLAKWSGASSLTNGDLSGDVSTSGTLVTTVNGLKGLALPTLAASTGFLFDNSGSLSLLATIPVADLTAGSSGQCINTSGSSVVWGSCAGTAGVQLIGTPFVGTSTVNTATTSQQNLAAACASTPCYAAGALNAVNKTFDIEAGGTVNLLNSSQSMSMGLNIGSNNQIAGTTSVNIPTSFGNWHARMSCVVTTAGSSGVLHCLLYFTFVGGTSAQSVWTTIIYNPNSSNGAIDLTTALSPGFWVAFGSASSSNSLSQTFAFTHQHN